MYVVPHFVNEWYDYHLHHSYTLVVLFLPWVFKKYQESLASFTSEHKLV